MSDGADIGSLAIGAGVAGGVGLAYKLVTGLFTRNVGAADRAADEMRQDVKNILLELRSMHDEQTRQRSDIAALGKEVSAVSSKAQAAHDRIDALVTPVPRGKR